MTKSRRHGMPAALSAAALVMAVAAGAQPLQVYTVNYPLHFFVERIGGAQVDAHFPAPAGVDPAFWVPGVEVIAAYQAADIVFLNGAGYAGWVQRASLPFNGVVDTGRAIRSQLVVDGDAVAHRHGPTGEDVHGALAFTTWLDPRLAMEQARVIRDTFVDRNPAATADFDRAFNDLRRRLESLDRAQQEIAAGAPARPLLGSHPVYQYLARRYGLNLVSLHWEPDTVPDDAEWGALKELLARHPAHAMLWEAEPRAAIRERLERLGVQSLVYAPCGNRPADGDYLQVMARNVDNLAAALR